MRSYNNLMDSYLSDENYEEGIKNATKYKGGNKKKNKQAKSYKKNAEQLKPELMEYAEYFYNEEHEPKIIHDGISQKQRTILIPTIREQIIHHMIMNILIPIFMKGMYEHSYGSIPERGALKGRVNRRRKGKKTCKQKTQSGQDTIQKWIDRDPKGMKYVLKLDIRKYFDSIPHRILKAKLAKLIKDKEFLGILNTIIDVKEDGVGIPIGFYTSQWFANWYLTELDHYITQLQGVSHYIRYMDDMIIFGSNKKTLHKIKALIEGFLRMKLGLELKGNWQVFLFDYIKRDGTRVGRPLDFMGLKFYRDKTTLRKSIMKKAKRKANKIAKKLITTVHDAQQMLSYLGWIDATNTYRMYEKYIKDKVNIHFLKHIVSSYQRRINKCGIMQKTAMQ